MAGNGLSIERVKAKKQIEAHFFPGKIGVVIIIVNYYLETRNK